MSKGSPRRTMRFPEKTVERIEAAIDSANVRRVETPYDWTAWVLQAVAEKLRSLERGRASSRRKRKKPAAAQVQPEAPPEVQAALASEGEMGWLF